ncbi:histidine kinase N-terminal 7TM domain-containing protein [Magnetospirillum aberrantis]|uniref:histidine kinase n=1 Tax=Magnetospirillum aberrantis SpK TaxID=908842 RepID=A0A7C9UX31_9PROT|nr:histidine kinase N-terminal 7TM domain-containing protein [Magnetospirillum aberrantis]NFV81109.1 response regulator [Magnetospirillum aberrantis SpK]
MPTAAFSFLGIPYALNPPAILLLAAVLVTLTMAWHASRMRRFPGRDRFVVMQVGAAIWALAAAMENMAQIPEAKILWAEMAWGGIVAAPTAWAMFVWSYGHGEEKLLPGRWAWLPISMPVVVQVLALTNDLHHLVYRSATPIGNAPGAPLDYHHGLLYFLVIVYLYGFMLFSVIAIIDAIHRSHGLYRRHYLGMAIAMMLPWAGNLGYVSGTFTLFDFDPTPFSFLVMGAIFHWLIYRRHLFELLPIARSALLDSLPDPLLILDGAGVVAEVNRAARDLAGGHQLVGRSFTELARVGEALAPLVRGHGADSEMDLAADGRQFEVRRTTLEREGNTVGVLLMFRDVTHRRQAEDRLRATLDDLQRAKAEAEAASRAKSDFLAVMSHEIRTPMNGVAAMAELLAQTRVDTEQSSMVSILRQSAESMLTIIDDILDFSKIEAGRLALERVTFDPTRLVEDVAQMVAPRAYEKGLEVVTDIDPALPSLIDGDPGRLRQILLNLAGNAVKFTERGHVLIRAENSGVGDIRFRVADTGIGIAPDHWDHLFQPFTQAEGSVARRYGGTGLGLSICKRLLDLMGGRIWLESIPGQGSVFSFSLPATGSGHPHDATLLDGLRVCVTVAPPLGDALRRLLAARGAEMVTKAADVVILDDGEPPPPQDAAVVRLVPFHHMQGDIDEGPVLRKPIRADELEHAVAIAAGRERATPSLHLGGETTYTAPPETEVETANIRLLVAEDSLVNRMVISKMLDRLGFAYDLTQDGDQALAMFRTRRYGMVLTDFHMPGMDGVTLARAIRREPGGTLPIVAMTADVLPQTTELCAAAGIRECLRKPVPLKRLEEVLARHLPRALELRRPVVEASPDAPPPAMPTLDNAPLVEIFGALNDEALALLSDFADNTASRLSLLASPLETGDTATARHHAHAARGSARSVGASALAETFGAIDDGLADGDIPLARRLAHQAEERLTEFRELLTVLDTRLKTAGKPEAPGKDVS